MSNNDRRKRVPAWQWVSATWLIGVISVVCAWFLVTAQTYSGNAWKYPTGVAAIAVVLCLVELARKLRRPSEMDPGEAAFPADWSRVVAVGSWLVGTVVLVYLIGLLAGVFVAVSVYFYAFVRRSVWVACGAGAAHSGFLWLAFDLAAGLRLYGGI